MDVVLCNARGSFFSTTTSVGGVGGPLSSSVFSFSFSVSFVSVFSTTGDFSLIFGDLSGVFDLDLDFRRVVVSPSSSELDDDELDDEELEDEPGGAAIGKWTLFRLPLGCFFHHKKYLV